MGTARSTSFTISSLLMIIAGAAGATVSVIIVKDRFNSYGTSKVFAVICAVLFLASAVINIISGISGLASYNKRIIARKFTDPLKYSLITCGAGLVISAFNGILIRHLIAVVIFGLVIPAFYYFMVIRKTS